MQFGRLRKIIWHCSITFSSIGIIKNQPAYCSKLPEQHQSINAPYINSMNTSNRKYTNNQTFYLKYLTVTESVAV